MCLKIYISCSDLVFDGDPDQLDLDRGNTVKINLTFVRYTYTNRYR